MPPKVVGAVLFRNEADRYLARVTENIVSLCDAVVCVDDGSEDGSAEVVRQAAKGAPCTIVPLASRKGPSLGFWGLDETTPRARLWQAAAAEAGPEGWVYVADADHLLGGLSRHDLHALCEAQQANAWAFPLYDLWDSEETYRCDGFWQAHAHPRPWLLRASPLPGWVPLWERRGIHAGHFPANYPLRALVAPPPSRILHLGYLDPAARAAKARKYVAVAELTEGERAHALSILEPPALAPLKPPLPRILVGSVVRKPPEVVGPWLATLEAQQAEARCDYLLVADLANTPYAAEVGALLQDFSERLPGRVRLQQSPLPNAGLDYGDTARTRAWTPQAWHRVGALKDGILATARAEDYDACWLLDADVLCDPFTLQSLMDCNLPIVAGIYWTHWQRALPGDAHHVHAGPQAWMRHPYEQDGGYHTAQSFRAALLARELVQVGGLGACTLIAKGALQKGVAFASVGDLGQGGMADGEDRHFCIRATQMHLPLFADAWPDIYHAYHKDEYDRLPGEWARLEAARTTSACPRLGDLVSARIELLEPIDSTWVGPQHLRGRLGTLRVLPELESLLARLPRRESALLTLRFPVHYPLSGLGGQQRLARVTLLDHKPFRLPPTVENELLSDPQSAALVDPTDRTEAHVRALIAS